MIPIWAQLGYLVAAVCFVLALKGLSSPRTARNGNLLGAAGAAVAVLITFFAYELDNLLWILIAVAIGSGLGVWGARVVAMTQMPQLVALFNGVGGAAAALVALLELVPVSAALDVVRVTALWRIDETGWFAVTRLPSAEQLEALTHATTPNLAAVSATVLIGGVSFAGSCVTFAKLQELMTTRPVIPPGGRWPFMVSLAAGVALGAVLAGSGELWVGLALAGVALAAGVLLVLPVGGADVPIVISLLNAFTGLAVAAGGYVLGNALLLVAGTLVGASGTILTRAMASAMGRSVGSILFGALKGGSTAGAGVASDRPVHSGTADDVGILLAYARRVVMVPGYGLAVAQAQHVLRELGQLLESKGIDVSYAIHPVAGRMPGHMNVLLAEADVPYEMLLDMEAANPGFPMTDVALVVGANDVVNPAAKTSPGSAIYGMPILDVDQAKAVVFLKRSMRPGFAGVENELLFDPRTTLLFGDAKASLTALLAAIKAL